MIFRKILSFFSSGPFKEHVNITTARDWTLTLTGLAGIILGTGYSKSYWTKWQIMDDRGYGFYPYTICSRINISHQLSQAGIPCPDIVMEEFYEYLITVCSAISTILFLAVWFVEISRIKYADFAYNLTAAVAFIIAGVLLIVSTLQIENLYDYLAPGFTQKENFMRSWKIAAGTLAFVVSIGYTITSYYIWRKGDEVPGSPETHEPNLEVVP